MPKSSEEILQEIRIGEKILVASNIAKFGTRPGLLDKMFGEEDFRRMAINERNIDPKGDEYKKHCQKAYKKFKKKFKNEDGDIDEDAFENALEKVNKIYNSRLKEAEEKDKVNWASVALNSMMLGATATGITKRIYGETHAHPERSEGSHSIGRDPSLRISKRNSIAQDDTPNYLESVTHSSPFVTRPFDGVHTELQSNDGYRPKDGMTIRDAINYLTEKSAGVPCDVLMFGASLSQNPTLRTTGIATTMLSMFPESEAVKVSDKDYKTTVYCGPIIDCEHLRKQAKTNKIELIEFDQKQEITSPKPEVDRLIIHAHGTSLGELEITEKARIQPDDFAAEYFPNAKIIHAFGCEIGSNSQENFGKNNLRKNQVLFLHAGTSETLEGLNNQELYYLLLQSNQHLPGPEPLQIIFKESDSSSIITSINPTQLEEIKNVIDSDNKINLVDRIYNLITDNISEQKASVLKQLENIPQESKSLIKAELERLGFVDFIEENVGAKYTLVKEYITEMLMMPKYFNSPDLVSNLELFLQSDLIDINHQPYDGSTLALIAADGYENVFEVLAKNGADLNKALNNGMTAFHIAVQGKQVKILEILVKYKPDDIDKIRGDGATPAFMAVQEGNIEIIEILLKCGASPDKADNDGVTLAFVAAEKGNVEALEVLLKYGADLNKAKNNGATPAFISAQNGCKEVLEVLAKNGADLNKARDDGTTPLFIAIQEGQVRALEVLLKNGANLNKTLNNGMTAFHIAVQEKQVKALELLLKHKPDDIDKTKDDGATPAFIAAEIGNVETLEVLTKNGADLNKARNDGVTPLLMAFNSLLMAFNSYETSKTKNLKDVIIFLVENGANPELETPFGSAYEFSSDEDLNKEVAKAREKYLDKNPSPSVEKATGHHTGSALEGQEL